VSVRLEWDGKPTRVDRVNLPFQTVETINESRATRERDTGSLFAGGTRTSDRNLLIWGDNTPSATRWTTRSFVAASTARSTAPV